MGQGAYLAWALPPGTARCDWRIELFPTQFWMDYLRLSAGGPSEVQRLGTMGIHEVLCDVEAQAGLIAELNRSPAWSSKSFGHSVLFRRRERAQRP